MSLDPTIRAIMIWTALTAAVMVWGGLLYFFYARISSRLLSGVKIQPKITVAAEEQRKQEEGYYFISVRSFEAEESLGYAVKALGDGEYDRSVEASYIAAVRLLMEIARRLGARIGEGNPERLVATINELGMVRIPSQDIVVLAKIRAKPKKTKSDAAKALNIASMLIRYARELRVEPRHKIEPLKEGD